MLVRLPGENSSIVTCIDGYEMARQGRADAALAVAAPASLFAGCVATLILAVFSPLLIELALLFGPPEYCSLMVLGLVAAIVIAQGPVDKALAMIVLGLTFAGGGHLRGTQAGSWRKAGNKLCAQAKRLLRNICPLRV
jgi:putative tricarboxylic transport membrane protein